MTKKLLLLSAIMLCLCLLLIACDKSDTDSGNTPQSKDETVTITFDSMGGSLVEGVIVEKGENIPKPADPTKDGYTLEGWYIDGEKWSFAGYVATKNMTLTANWVPVDNDQPSDTTEYVTVTFDKANGEAPYPIQVEKGTNISKPADPTKDGYTFEGWYIDGEKWSFAGYVATKNMTLTANWTPIVYTITYVAEGEHSNNSTYTIEDELELLYSEKNFSNCLGWYEDEEFTIPVSKIEKGTIGNKTFYAKEEYTPVRFLKNDNGYVAIGCDSKANEVVVPSIYNGKPVTSIGNYAFYNCDSLTSVTIPNSVTSIGNYAFYNCDSLTSVTIPNSVTSIGDRAFENCTSLTSVTIGGSVTSIGIYAFENCTSLASVTIPNSVTSISEGAFSYCNSLTSVIIPNSVTSISGGAFADCTSLTSVVIPNSVTSIGSYAFEGCTSLTIYCEATSKPSGWNSSWNLSNCTVVWGYKQGN